MTNQVSLVRFATFSFAILVGTQLSAAPPLDLSDAKVDAKIRSLVKPYFDAKQFNGLSIGVIAGNQSKTFHFGKTSKGGDTPTDDTVYEIGSISKVFTGVLLGDAVVQNKVALDQNAGELVPAGATMPSKDGKSIKVLDLSIHRSGLPRLSNNMKSLRTDNPYSDYTSDQALAFLSRHRLRRAPGEKAEYSNFAVSLLGFLLTNQSGQTYDELLQNRIAQPLGMTSTTVTENREVLSRLAQGHRKDGAEASTWEFADMPGAGGIRSTIPDMLRFARANLEPTETPIGKAIELAWKQHHKGVGNEFSMGLGWHIARDGQTRWHNGQTGGYHSMLMVNRNHSTGIILLTNTATREADRLAEDIMRLLSGMDVKPRDFPKQVQVSAEKMERCAGKYQLLPGLVFNVEIKNDRLMVQLTGQPSLQVFPTSETQWFYKAVEASLTFKKERNGKFQELELFQGGLRQTAKRIR